MQHGRNSARKSVGEAGRAGRADGSLRAALWIGGSALALAAAQPAWSQTQAGSSEDVPAAGATSTSAEQGLGTQQQDQAPAPAGEVTVEDTDRDEIVITGIRQSLSGAQNIKRNADTVVDAITAADIGSLPDRSINEALQRVPGVAITRFAAANDSARFSVQGSGVVIRGLNFVRSEFNGRDTFAASSGRGLGFDSVPSELAGSVEVFKNLTADRIEGGIAGTVSINTRKPFDLDKRLIYASAAMSYGDLAQKGGPAFVGLYSDQWSVGDGNRFGVLIGGSYSQQFNRADSIFLNAFQPRFNAPADANGDCSGSNVNAGKIINAGQPYALRVCDAFPTPAGLDTVYTPLGAGFRSQDFNRHRNSINAAAQFETADKSLLVTAQYVRSYFDETWNERTIESNNWYPDAGQIFPAGYLNQPGFPYNPNANFSYNDDGVFQSGTLVHSGDVPYHTVDQPCTVNGNVTTYCPYTQYIPGGITTLLSNRVAYNKVKAQDASLNVAWSPTSRLHLTLDGQYAKSGVENRDDAVNIQTLTNVSIDLTGKYPDVRFVTPGFNTASYLADLGGLYYTSAVNNRAVNDGDEYALRGDLRYELSDDSFFRDVRVGGRYSRREQTVRTNDFSNWGSLSVTWNAAGPTYLGVRPDVLQTYGFPDFFHDKAGSQPPTSAFISTATLKDHDALSALLRSVRDPSIATYTPLEDRGPNLIKGYFLPGEIYVNSEDTWAGYASTSFGHDFAGDVRVSGNIGVRYVRTTDKSNGAITLPNAEQVTGSFGNDFTAYCASATTDPNQPVPALCRAGVTAAQQQAALAFSNGASIPDVANQSFDHWLPSLNLRLDVSPQLLFRFAASRAISRPEFGDLRNYVSINYNNLTGGFQAQSRNPFLRPVEADQFDLTAEWYFAKVGSLTTALFYKNISNVILTNQVYTRPVTNAGQTSDVAVSGPANATGKSKVKGAEVAYQQTFDFLPGPLAGLGAQASYTFIDVGRIVAAPPSYSPSNNFSETGNQPLTDITGLYENLPLEGLSTHNFNLAAFYDRGGLTARIAYSWRSKYLLTRQDCCFPFGPVYSLASGQADASILYTVNRNFKIGLEVQNLLDATTRTAFVLDKDGLTAPRSWFKSDRQFAVSSRVTF